LAEPAAFRTKREQAVKENPDQVTGRGFCLVFTSDPDRRMRLGRTYL